MSAKNALENCIMLRDELYANKTSDKWPELRKMNNVILKCVLMERSYIRRNMKFRPALLGEELALWKEDGKNLRIATAVNKEIGKRLRENSKLSKLDV